MTHEPGQLERSLLLKLAVAHEKALRYRTEFGAEAPAYGRMIGECDRLIGTLRSLGLAAWAPSGGSEEGKETGRESVPAGT